MNDFWWRDAACAQIGEYLFFTQAPEARRVCRDLCLVREHCLADSLNQPAEYGIVAGLGRDQRFALANQVNETTTAEQVAQRFIDREYQRERKRADRRRHLARPGC